MPRTKEFDFLECFERGLDTNDIGLSKIPARVLGYGEISTIFQIENDNDWAYKRMPLFETVDDAQDYGAKYQKYCAFLRQAGINLPEDKLQIVSIVNEPVVLYIVQRQLPAQWFAHNLLHSLDDDAIFAMLERLVPHLLSVWQFNSSNQPEIELALDAQLSNWVFENGDVTDGKILYVDTSTPLFRLEGIEQLNPELILQSAPSFLRWIIRWLFLKDVMERYYDQHKILIDLAANLYKEQRPDLIPGLLDIVNRARSTNVAEISTKEVADYYREDKMIWVLFLMFRRFDRWLKQSLLHKNYVFILPGKIKR
ncbi:MAG: hypothetical protein HQ528_05885 [Candidatus Marinimicrobia bacterium]|nr:hypothetical protein [Candidatus Neomarinimicrobiota bacterium]